MVQAQVESLDVERAAEDTAALEERGARRGAPGQKLAFFRNQEVDQKSSVKSRFGPHHPFRPRMSSSREAFWHRDSEPQKCCRTCGEYNPLSKH
eukprot:59697-Rhodomonas_salina.2